MSAAVSSRNRERSSPTPDAWRVTCLAAELDHDHYNRTSNSSSYRGVLMRLSIAIGITACFACGAALAQAPAPAANAAPKPFAAGTPLSATNEKGVVQQMSKNVKVYGSFHFAESCTFDPEKNLIVAMNAANARDTAPAGSPPPLTPNDGFVSLINPDGSVHTSKWIGATRDGLTLVHPLGSAIQGGTLYVN